MWMVRSNLTIQLNFTYPIEMALTTTVMKFPRLMFFQKNLIIAAVTVPEAPPSRFQSSREAYRTLLIIHCTLNNQMIIERSQ